MGPDLLRKISQSSGGEFYLTEELGLVILSVVRITLGTVFLLMLILEIFNYHGGKWTSRLCKLNILVIGASLVSVKYKASEADNCNNTT